MEFHGTKKGVSLFILSLATIQIQTRSGAVHHNATTDVNHAPGCASEHEETHSLDRAFLKDGQVEHMFGGGAGKHKSRQQTNPHAIFTYVGRSRSMIPVPHHVLAVRVFVQWAIMLGPRLLVRHSHLSKVIKGK